MVNRDEEIHKRKNGIYYTPEKLARYLAEPLINKKTKQFIEMFF